MINPFQETNLGQADGNDLRDADYCVHQVIGGERIDQIAFKYLGDPNAWPKIAKLNQLIDPARLQSGQILRVPLLSIMEDL